ncbi:MAG: DUF885 domain-containing protein [Lachnospiraceae bacterium]|nr:DUF885 domain-containing protein [Lachnospiraceae bacterium]
MKLLNNKKRKWAVGLGLAALALALMAGVFYFSGRNSFSAFCENLAKSSLNNNPLKLHYTLADPESMGYGGLSTTLLSFDQETYEKKEDVWQEYLDCLNGYDPDSLSEEEAFTWQLLYRYFTLEGQLSEYFYYENPLSPSDGSHIQLPVLLAEYTFRSREDVENYLTLLSQLPDYFRGLLTYARLQAENGILQYEGNLETAARQCESVLNEEQLAAGSHFLQTTFAERLEDLRESGEAADGETAESTNGKTSGIAGGEATGQAEQKREENPDGEGELTEEDIAELTERNGELLTELALAYQELAEGLREIPGADEMAGLSGYSGGADYYALLLADATGSDRSVGEIKDLLYERFEKLYTEYKELITEGNVISEYDFPIEQEAEMLEDLYQRMGEDFPALSVSRIGNAGADETAQTVTLKPVDSGLEEMMAPAFYLTPPVDQNQEHTIYINQSNGYEGLSLYTTLAHEGFPGHLYQTVYSQNALTQKEAPFIRQLLYFGGYVEGWGLYAEACACQYAAELLAEVYGEDYEDTVRAAQMNRELQLCLCSILDIFIHYDGATLVQVQKLLQSLGFGSGNISAVYETICNTPANYPKYYVGYLEILELKELALESGAASMEKEFHQWLLSAGPADFSSLRERLGQE